MNSSFRSLLIRLSEGIETTAPNLEADDALTTTLHQHANNINPGQVKLTSGCWPTIIPIVTYLLKLCHNDD